MEVNNLTGIFKTDVIELKKIMVEKRIDTIMELSERSGINRNTLSQVLAGNIQPSADVMNKLVYTLDIDAEKAGLIFFNSNLLST